MSFESVALLVILTIGGLCYWDGYSAGSRHYFATCPEIHDQLLSTEVAAKQCQQKLDEAKNKASQFCGPPECVVIRLPPGSGEVKISSGAARPEIKYKARFIDYSDRPRD